MDTFLNIMGTLAATLAILLLFGIGLAGCIIPMVPGHPLILGGILVAELTVPGLEIAWYHWVILILLCIIGMLCDTFLSLWGANRFGSTKAGLIGCGIGIFVGLFFTPWGIIVGPFIGALAAEILISRTTLTEAFKSGSGAFIGTMAGFLAKLMIGFMMIVYLGVLLLALL